MERGEHLHIFVLVDADSSPPQAILNTFDDGWLTKECRKHKLNDPWIASPSNEVHAGNYYAQLPYLGPTNRATEQAKRRLVDAMEWLTYIYKARDKLDAEWEKQGQIFSASRPNRDKKATPLPYSRPIILGEATATTTIMTGDRLLDVMITKTQHTYQRIQVSAGAVA